MAKILRVCNSENLPPILERSNSYIYFVYDKMSIYLGQNFYSDPFCIVEQLPPDPIPGMLYITLDGLVKTYYDSKEITIGIIESDDQLQYLLEAGTIYFMKAEYRYLDRQTRLLNLPFQNGNYQLSVQSANNLKIDENTVIKFNPLTDRFEISGTLEEYPWETVNNNGYIGEESSSIRTTVNNNSIKADLKISDEIGNILKIYGNGLYANIGEIATEDQIKNLALEYENYRTYVEAKMKELRDEMDEKGFNLTPDSLAEKIMNALEEYKPTIEEMFANYDYINEQLGFLRDSTTNYADEKIEEAKAEIIEYIQNITSVWNEFDEEGESIVDTLSEEEAKIIANALDSARLDILATRELDVTYQVDFSTFVITDQDGINDGSDVILLPKSLEVESVPGSKIGYTYLTISPEKEEETNRYFYKETDICPRFNEVLDGYKEWNGISEIQIENDSIIYLVETDIDQKAKKYAKVKIKSRLEKPNELEILTITSMEGSAEGTAKVNISPTIEDGNMYVFKKSTTIPEYNSILPEEYKTWDGSSEITADYDKQMLTFVECTSDFRRAKKVGLVYVDLADELLKSLDIETDAGTVPISTIITNIFPNKSSSSIYLYKIGDTSIPEINSYIVEDDIWKLCQIGDQIQFSYFTDGLVVVETNDFHRVKKAGVVLLPNMNNELVAELIYDKTEYMKNIVSVDLFEGSNLYYYITSKAIENISHLKYGSILTSEFSPVLNNQVVIMENRRVVLAETTNTNQIIRFGIYDPVIEYAGELENITATNNDGFVTVSNIPIDNNYLYYAQIMTVDDEKKYILNESINPDDYLEWDGQSVIQINDSTDIFMIKVLITDQNNRVIYIGKCVIN